MDRHQQHHYLNQLMARIPELLPMATLDERRLMKTSLEHRSQSHTHQVLLLDLLIQLDQRWWTRQAVNN